MKLSSATAARTLFICAAIALGSLQAWASRMTLVNDTVSYLDMGNYIFQGQWFAAIDGIWNPLFAFVLGMTMAAVKPSPYWEYPVVHLVMLCIFLFTLACFDFFLQEIILLRQRSESQDELHVPTWVWLTIGYTLFLWSSLALVGVSETNPDMLVAAFFYAACGLLARMRRGVAGWPTHAALGLVLGLGYLTKAILFPISLICFAIVWFLEGRSPAARRRVVLGCAVFLMTSMPFVVALSTAKHKLTFGETGWYNYLVDIDHVPNSHWQGDGTAYGQLLHPTRQIFDRPAAYEFSSTLKGTYPVWYDPSYWYEGAKPDYRVGNMLAKLAGNLRSEAIQIIIALNGSVVASLFLLFWASNPGRLILTDIRAMWFLLVPSIAALGLYAVLHIETRYLASFLVVILSALFFSLHFRPTAESHRLFQGAALLLLVMFLSPIGPGAIAKNSGALLDLVRPSTREPNPNAEIAKGLENMGLQPGDAIASLQYSNCAIRLSSCEGAAMWAHLGRFRIVSEIYYTPVKPETSKNNFWNANPATQAQVIEAFAKTGARVVVSRQEPEGVGATGWRQIGDSAWYALWLPEPAPGAGR
jgi:hypothetical protein